MSNRCANLKVIMRSGVHGIKNNCRKKHSTFCKQNGKELQFLPKNTMRYSRICSHFRSKDGIFVASGVFLDTSSICCCPFFKRVSFNIACACLDICVPDIYVSTRMSMQQHLINYNVLTQI